MPAKGDAASATKSAVAPGTIDIRENPTQDISALSRDTANALNELGRIFDKKTVEEQQELAQVFGEEAFRLAHNLSDDGSGKKIAVHAVIGGIMSTITGAGFASGAIGAGVNEAIINEIKKIKDPGTAQIVSAIIGAAAAKAIGGNAGAGASAAASGTKNNLFSWTKPLLKEYFKTLHPEEMPANYLLVGKVTGGELITGEFGFMIDAFGNVYELVGGGVGGSVLPADFSKLEVYIQVDRDVINADNIKQYVEGFSFGGNGSIGAHVGGSISLDGSNTKYIELGGTTNAGWSVGISHAEFIYNIYE